VGDQTFSVAENTPNGTAVGTIAATDPDAGQTRTFSVTGGTGQSAFAVSAAGVITVADSTLLNFETAPSFTLNVTVTDNGTPTLSDTAVITINLTNVNEAPVVNDQTFAVSSNATNGTAVGVIAATDVDAGTILSFNITSGNTNGAFALDAATGQMTVGNAAALTGASSFVLNVSVSDNGTPNLNDTAVITINVTNVNQAPVVNDQTFSVAENTANGTAVGTIVATDPDAGQTRTFNVTGGTGQTAFAVSAAGVVTVADSASLNFETAPSFILNVTVMDNGSPTLSDTAVITINLNNVNEPPSIVSNGGGSNATLSMPENTTEATSMTVADPDAGTTLVFSLSGNDSGKFKLTGSGNSRLLSFIAAPDFEFPTDTDHDNVYDVTVQVSDGVLTHSQSIAVGVTDVEDTGNTAPVAFNDTAFTTLNTAVTINILANDTDNGSLATSSVSIATAPANGSVVIDEITGAATYTPAIGFFGTDSFTYTVNDDQGLTSNVATVSVTVQHDASRPYAALMADPADPKKTVLLVLGTNGNDRIRIEAMQERSGGKDHDTDEIEVVVNNKSLGVFLTPGRILIFGLDGNDQVNVSKKIGVPVSIY
jgi:hypothetical protein